MITLNRLGHSDEPFQLNTDMIVTVESTPDTVITLATGTKVVVAETPDQVAAAVHSYRASVLAEAFRRRGTQQQRQPSLASVHRRRATAGGRRGRADDLTASVGRLGRHGVGPPGRSCIRLEPKLKDFVRQPM